MFLQCEPAQISKIKLESFCGCASAEVGGGFFHTARAMFSWEW